MVALAALLVCLPLIVLGLLPAARRLVGNNPKWAVIFCFAYYSTMTPLISLAIDRRLSRLFSGPSTAWIVFPFMLVFGLASGWGVWKLMEANRPPATRY